LNAL